MYLHISRPHLISTAELDIVLRAPYLDIQSTHFLEQLQSSKNQVPINTAIISSITAMAEQPMISYATVDGTLHLPPRPALAR